MATRTAPGELHATPLPGVYIARRPGGGWHVVENAGSPFALCTTCRAAENGRDCWAVTMALAHSETLLEETRSMTETTTAVELAQKSTAVVKATEARLAVAEHLAGWKGLVELGAAHRATGLAPAGFDTPEKCALALLKAIELDVPLTSAYEDFYIVKGRVGIQAKMVRALVEQKMRGDGYIHVESATPQKAVCVGYRKGRKPVRVEFTIEDAQRAGLLANETYKKFPADMLVAKASARVGRRLFADVLGGMVVADGDVVLDSTGDEPEGQEIGRAEVLEGEFRPIHETVRGEPVDAETGEIDPGPPVDPPVSHASTGQPPLELGETDGARMQTLFDEAIEALTAAGLTPGALSLSMRDAIGTGQWCPENLVRWVEATGQSPTELVQAVAARS